MNAIRAAAESILLGCCADLRTVIYGLEPEALMWRPAPQTSPIAILIRHCATGTPMLLRAAATGRIDRKRYVEEERIPAFADRVSDAAELRELIDQMESDVRRLLPEIPDEVRARSNRFPRLRGRLPAARTCCCTPWTTCASTSGTPS